MKRGAAGRCSWTTQGDVVLLREKRDSHDGRLVKLKATGSTHTHRGVIQHADVIGKESRQIVQSSKGATYRVIEPTLAEYVRLTPRLVTPLYPSDTNLIVSLLDIHVDRPSPDPDSEPPFEILEAGTGHGALTLHLSRAIHAANPPLPKTPSITTTEEEPEDAVYLGESMSDLGDSAIESWKQNRRAIIHTLDISSKHSQHAKKIVQGFRHGMYSENVDFHVGDISDWIAKQQASRKTDKPFLAHVFLDLPNANSHLANVIPALHVNGLLAVFNPSITQIAECVERIREQRMPYLLDQVIELGTGTIREWDVRAVRPKATVRKAGADQPSEPSSDEGVDSEQRQAARDSELEAELSKQEEEKWVMVCRPKVGEMVVGGGFLGLWRRMEITSTKESSD
ncbi:Adenine-N(1)--methyltransferase-like protein [Pyrenophora tritici-repentis]|uniref:Adenine-N--methyltransferas protein n=1 Tax=Pyrenophora tritici-repentis TaxID=45151 RepID=A0A2W1DNY8_9PLEO|nr:Adenine-N-methyltransferas protein [Pyrenophora tritici-repentis]KAI0574286.1 Adenine-N(1)--methyltransferase-like protein [Pyrenophora tritici-repentis]KAI0585002.1 Adenine-N(1)--methyltransferase-like protein [Pyrenophora tritici-repentis]KAI0610830.1 Adenine-N(1)--methyltransferase-like protein [Pyrenophora tritici-repentis]KAI0620859.1 Adenine-N(1)--methyltransferase-like protein [Pyrenophora tritici-repentis]